ncbi:MAG: hypothetical protein V2A73_02775 [Pseudomonadota bacterium]
MTHRTALGDIDRLFVRQTLSRWRWRRLRVHLAECLGCRSYYEQVVRLETALTGKDWHGSFWSRGIESELIGCATHSGGSADSARAAHRYLPVAVSLAMAAFIFVVGGRWAGWFAESDDRERTGRLAFSTGEESAGTNDPSAFPSAFPAVFPGMQARGLSAVLPYPSSAPDTNASARSPNLRPICIPRNGQAAPKGDEPSTKTGVPLSVRTTRCTMTDDLVLTYSPGLDDRGFAYVFVMGVDDRGLPLWYGPRPFEHQSLRIPAGEKADLRRLPGATRLAVNHRPGQVRVFAMLSKEPITCDEVDAAIASLRSLNTAPASVAALPLGRDDVATAVADLEIVP